MGRTIGGVVLILCGLALGVFLGLYVFLAGGIVAIVHAAQHDPVNVSGIVWGVIRVWLSVLAFYVGLAVGVIPGVALLND